VRLKVSAIDSQRMMVRVEQGKGQKDRYTILSQQLLVELRSYWKEHRSPLIFSPTERVARFRCLARWLHAHPSLRFFGQPHQKNSLPQCRKLFGLNPALPQIPKRSAQDLLRQLTGIDLYRCSSCKLGTLIVVGELPP
jgi:hypothetical protein